jgi:hypothetical protein
VGSTPDVGGVWATHSPGAGQIAVSQGAITVRGGSSTYSEDVNSPFTPVVSTGSVYAGMDLNYPTPSSLTGTAVVTYFTHFIVSGLTYACRVYPTGHTSTGYKLAIGVFNEAATVYSTYGTTTEMAYGTTYRLVYSFNTTDDKCSLWVNPTSENSTSIMTASAGTTTYSISAVAFRQATATPPGPSRSATS